MQNKVLNVRIEGQHSEIARFVELLKPIIERGSIALLETSHDIPVGSPNSKKMRRYLMLMIPSARPSPASESVASVNAIAPRNGG
jgi:hypothetical protein